MKYIKDTDYDYIKNKYHDTKKPFDPFCVYIRRDEIFDESTGMDPDKIKEGILNQDSELESLPHTIRKAKAFAYVLKNTRISCDCRDIFPAINMIDRPLSPTIISKWRKEVFSGILPEIGKKMANYEERGIVTIWPDYDHSVPVWERVFSLGFKGILEESEKIRSEKSLNDEEDTFFEGIKITYSAIIDFVERLEEQALKTKGSEKMAVALSNIKAHPPKTFYEALLVDYIYFMVSEHIWGLRVRSICNFDRIFYDYYKNDLENGVTENEIRTQLAYFFMQYDAIDSYWNHPVFLGGCKADESTIINELSYLFLDVYNDMNIYNPKIQIKVAESTPKDFIKKALDMIRNGNNCIVFVSDALIRKALVNSGATEEQARLSNITGCYEYSVQGAVDCGMNYFNLVKPLQFAFHEGCDEITGELFGLKCKPVQDFETFDEFYNEYKRQLKYLIDSVIEIVNSFENYLTYINPQSMLSATNLNSLEKVRDAFDGGGVQNISTIAFGFIADVADSLAMIKKYVFDKKEITLSQLKDMLDSNFEGNETFRIKLLNDRDKFGNNKELPDKLAKDIIDYTVSEVCNRPNAEKRGGRWNCSYHVARMSYIQGELTGATPNGRVKGEELSKNCSPSMGQNREGATAAILSVTNIDASAFCGDASLDLGLLPSAVKGDDGLEAMYGLLMTFISRGGHAIHINVFDADTLRDAQANPEKYQDLQIRVCGWNVLWNNINKKEQDGFIRQAESLV